MHRAVHSYKGQAVDADALIRQHAGLIDLFSRKHNRTCEGFD